VKLKVRIYTKSEIETYQSVFLTVSNIEAIDVYIVDGTNVTPSIDDSKITYKFKTKAVKNNSKDTELVIEFVPHSKTRVSMTVEFDDSDFTYD
jgi:hypothetical protein